MPEDNKEQQTEQATPRRKRETREKGQVAYSREVSSVFVLMGSLLVLYFAGTYMITNLMSFSRYIFSEAGWMDIKGDRGYLLFHTVLNLFYRILLPILLVVFTTALLSGLIQTGGFLFSIKPITIDLSRLSPIKGLRKLFSKNASVELLKSIFKIVIVGYISYITIKAEFVDIPPLMNKDTGDILIYISGVVFKILFRTFWALLILAGLDYAFQKWSFEENLKMTKEEVKEERKETEGDPLIKARIRSIQMRVARHRMMEAVPRADVVITNPFHIAVALEYKSEKMSAPAVVAKGGGVIAERIKEIARKSDIPIVENKPLARTLYKLVRIGEAIPVSLYKAVAEILAYVYKLKGIGNRE
ncbi:MAG: flagellar biosynthesis protein FlhB [Nitrospinae bacterium]|nr:flagellar biosynthesis protein FlhB [Nitrospinota bacterium]